MNQPNELDKARASFAADVAAALNQTERIAALEQALHDLRNETTWRVGTLEVELAEVRQQRDAWREAAQRLRASFAAYIKEGDKNDKTR